MCSRYNLTAPPEAVRSYFQYRNEMLFPPRYNIAPTQPAAIVRLDPKGEREIVLVRWGLIPGWVKDPGAFSTLINARSETAAEKPSFRGAMRHRRCLVPATGFYEWMGPAGGKRPHLIRPRAGGLLALAGLNEHWLGADGSEIETMAILTTAANGVVGKVHDRMPVILEPESFPIWLDCKPGTAVGVQPLLRPAAEELLEVVEVSARLNNVRNEGPDLIVETRTTLL
mgnify:CR=1 FL=1